MPRRRREDAPGTVHHVWARGLEGRAIFLDARDRRDFLERLCEVLPAASCLVWAFMTNHFHMLLRTGAVPLSTLMRRIHTGYAVRFNLRHGRQGYLFQSRFGSRVIRDDADLLTVTRYVLQNPLKAGLVADLAALEKLPWCGYGALLGRRGAHPFESVSEALAIFGSDADLARSRLRAWMAEPDGLDVQLERVEPLEGVDLSALIREVCQELDVVETDVLRGRRSREVSRARTRICVRAVRELGMRPCAVARALGLSESAVSQALRRGASPVSEDGGPSPS